MAVVVEGIHLMELQVRHLLLLLRNPPLLNKNRDAVEAVVVKQKNRRQAGWHCQDDVRKSQRKYETRTLLKKMIYMKKRVHPHQLKSSEM